MRPRRALGCLDNGAVELDRWVELVVERQHGAQVLFENEAALAILRPRIAVALPVGFHPCNDLVVVGPALPCRRA